MVLSEEEGVGSEFQLAWNSGYLILFFNAHPRRCLLLLERQEGRDTGREREKGERQGEREKERLLAASHRHPDWGLNSQHFGTRDDAPTN